MSRFFTASFEVLNAVCVTISSYTLVELVNLYSFDIRSWSEDSILKLIAVLSPIVFYTVSTLLKLVHAKRNRDTVEMEKEKLRRELSIIKQKQNQELINTRTAEFVNSIEKAKLEKLRRDNENIKQEEA